MAETLHVGRVGSLAAALGIGAAILYGGCGIAAADPAESSGAESSSSAPASGTSAPGASASGATGADSSPSADDPGVSADTPSSTADSPGPAATTSSSTHVTAPGTAVGTGGAHTGSYSTSTKDRSSTRTESDDSTTDVEDSVVQQDSISSEDPATEPAPGDGPTAPTESLAALSVASTARKETTTTESPAVVAASASTTATGPAAAPAAPAIQGPPVVVMQTAPLEWLQHVPVVGPVFVTPVVAAIHQIPIIGDVIHPFIGYPVRPGTPGAPASRDVLLTSFDGTQIYVHFMPAKGLRAGQRATTILQGPGLGMPGATNLDGTILDGILTDNLGAVGVGVLRAAGYNVVTWDPRGEYRSGGTLELDSPDFEARDTSAIISWVATLPEVQLDATGDPRMGMVGASYGGGIQFVTAATDHRVDAIVPTIAWNSLNSSLYKSRAFKSGWGTLLTAALLLTNARPNPAIYPASIYGNLTGTLTQEQQDLLSERGPGALLGSITAPTLLIQGTVDTLFSLQEAQANAMALMANGVPTKVLWFCGGHGLCTNNLFDPTDGQVITTQTLAWLAHYVKGQQNVSTGPQFEWVDQRGQFFSSTTYPAAPAASIVASSSGAGALPLIPLIGGSGPLLFVLPIGGTRAINAFNLTTPAASQTTYVVGAPQLTLTYSGTGTSRHVFAQLVDDATGAVLGNQVTPIPVTLDGQSHTVTIPLEQVAHTLSAGQTLTLQVVASTANYENFGSFGVLNVANLGVSLPTITDAVARNAAPATLSA
ncbi:S15 peptidase family protein [Mycolicibacterium arabiense]|uniref:S15 peptidase family protein n=1 Tax=Mycolicibacterium arabiense TaxID=1286181 RepID=UPI0027E2E963|nr:CocE/NonD family hydrolase [Mycolicibacterium arabiense]